MVQAPTAAPSSALIVELSPPQSAAFDAATDVGIAAYLDSGERMRILAGWVAAVCMALIAAIAVMWALGLLPIAAKLF